jgi:hypothetical protein
VTPENNAAPWLLRALGPQVIDERVRDRVLAELGISLEAHAPGKFVNWRMRTRSSRPTATTRSRTLDIEIQPATSQAWDDNVDIWDSDFMDLLDKGEIHPSLEPWLEENAEAFDLARRAAECSHLYVPLLSPSSPPNLVDGTPTSWNAARDLTRALAMHARVRAMRGDFKNAWADILTIHRLSGLIAQGPTLVERFVALAVQGHAVKEGTFLATHCSLPPDEARDMVRELDALPPWKDLADIYDRSLRFECLDMVMVLWRGQRSLEELAEPMPKLGGKALDCNQLLRTIN